MRLALVSYYAPPYNAARAARLANLAKRALAAGHRVQIHSVDLGGNDELLSQKVEGATQWRYPAGWLERNSRTWRKTHGLPLEGAGGSDGKPAKWRQWAQKALHAALVPDREIEWLGRAIWHPTDADRPDVVISFAPPFGGAVVGNHLAHKWGVPHLLDYGDPWTFRHGYPIPAWRTPVDWALERTIVGRARGVIVNAMPQYFGMKQVFSHQQNIVCIANGFDPDDYPIPGPVGQELRYLGAMYGIRLPLEPLGEALRKRGERAVFYGDRPNMTLPVWADGRMEVGYRESLGLMQTAKALLLLGNRGGLQIPSKLYSYLGAGRPILAIVESTADPIAQLGGPSCVTVLNRREEIVAGLARIDAMAEKTFQPTEEFSWDTLGPRYLDQVASWIQTA